MLNKKHFDRELEVVHEEHRYEVIRPLGHPMVLFDGTTGAPIASLHFASGDCRTFITERHIPGPTASFLGVMEEDKRAISLVITNLQFKGMVLVNITHGKTGDGPLVNSINCIEPNQTVPVESDFSRNECKLVLDSLAIPAGQTVADSVVQDEARTDSGPKGTYLSIAVYPPMGGNYRNAVWRCVDLFVRQIPDAARPPTAGTWGGSQRRYENDFHPASSRGGFEYSGPGFGFGPGHGTVVEGGQGGWSSGSRGGGWGSHGPAPAAISTAAMSFGASSNTRGSAGGWGTAAAANMAQSVANVGRPLPSGGGGGFGSAASPPAFTPASPPYRPSSPRGEMFGGAPPSPSFGGFGDEYALAEFAATEDAFSAANTRAATLRSDTERVRVDGVDVSYEAFDTNVGTRLATLCLSVIAVGQIEMLDQLSKADALHRAMEMAHDTIVNSNKRLLATLERGVHSSEECVICTDARTSVVFITCGHQCVCEGCSKKLEKNPCPMCRAVIAAKIHV
jgi:hypothetical protein